MPDVSNWIPASPSAAVFSIFNWLPLSAKALSVELDKISNRVGIV